MHSAVVDGEVFGQRYFWPLQLQIATWAKKKRGKKKTRYLCPLHLQIASRENFQKTKPQRFGDSVDYFLEFFSRKILESKKKVEKKVGRLWETREAPPQSSSKKIKKNSLNLPRKLCRLSADCLLRKQTKNRCIIKKRKRSRASEREREGGRGERERPTIWSRELVY